MAVTPANRDRLREQAFALSSQGFGLREIARRLDINKETAGNYVREERSRRSHDRSAEDAVRDAVASLRHVLNDLHDQYGRISGDSPHSMYARAKVAEAIRRCCRDLIGMYGMTLPETDPEVVSMKRMIEMVGAPFSTPDGYPEVGDQAVLERHLADEERRLVNPGVIVPEKAPMISSSDDGDDHYLAADWGDDVGSGY